jgi:hypothetical protein
MELARQSAHFGERISRLQRELKDQSRQAECIRELKAEIEHLKLTRFEAKRESHSIKTSLSWRLTWPLRLLQDAGVDFILKSQRRVRLLFGRRLLVASVAAGADPSRVVTAGFDEQQPAELF